MNLGPFSPTAYWEGFNTFLSSRPKALKPYLSLPSGIIIDLLDPPVLSSVNSKNWPEELELHWRVKVVSPSLRVKNCLVLTPTTMCSMLYINQCAAFLPKKTDLKNLWHFHHYFHLLLNSFEVHYQDLLYCKIEHHCYLLVSLSSNYFWQISCSFMIFLSKFYIIFCLLLITNLSIDSFWDSKFFSLSLSYSNANFLIDIFNKTIFTNKINTIYNIFIMTEIKK